MADSMGIVRRPLVTEKAAALKAEANKIAFEVRADATKAQIKQAVQAGWNVTVEDVTTMGYRGKMKRVGRHMGLRSSWKKAIVTLKEGDDIDVLGQGAQE